MKFKLSRFHPGSWAYLVLLIFLSSCDAGTSRVGVDYAPVRRSPIHHPNSNGEGKYIHPRVESLYQAEPELLRGYGHLHIQDQQSAYGGRHYKLDSIVIDSRIPTEDVDLIGKDLRHLQTLGLDQSAIHAEQLRQLLELHSIDGSVLKSWFEDRVQIILSHQLWRYSGQHFLAYNLYADIFQKNPMNFYRAGYRDFVLSTGFAIDYPNGEHPVKGVIKLFPSLLKRDSLNYYNIDYSRSLFRISILLHEAMHSLGNHADHSFSMLHSTCPFSLPRDVGHPFCDPFTNGSYQLQDHFLAWSIETCQSCSEHGKNALRMMRMTVSERSQALGSYRRFADLTPELNP